MDKEIKRLRDELWNLIFNEHRSKYRNQKINEVMEKLIPKNNKLYRYRSINDNTIDILENDTIFLSNPNELNDPYDCHMHFDHQNYFAKEIDKIGENLAKPVLTLLDEMNRKIKTTQGIACFADRNDSILMWSHYTSDHKGICIEYNYQDIIEYIDMRKSSSEGLSLLPVRYSNEITQYNLDDLENPKKLASFIFSKSDIWSYENEWRLIETINREKKDIPGTKVNFIKPTAIYLGTNISSENEQKIKEIISKEIQLYKMEMSSYEYKLSSKKVLER
ncbi:DUF2971 domain-containing protein [Alcaligenes faecalis]|uniref:DUF2971 domain-containing protein n=1 Tax=Alcaligenes faecalis TaxID=511 RepID=UPI0018D02FD0|nr:DUF2971 domain-containing protein [Alcaligenes faecalis]MBH0311917.1 DUF2971 domain-containing protein [Alcaligenes faecalis]